MMMLIMLLLILVPLSIMSALATIEVLFDSIYHPIHKFRWVIAGLVGLGAAGFILVQFSESNFLFDSKNVTVQYREDRVDVSEDHFEPFVPKSKGDFFNGAWYDEKEEYMIIRLGDKYYHYCGLPSNAWNALLKGHVPDYGDSLTYMHYEKYIKGNYDCRTGHVPNY